MVSDRESCGLGGPASGRMELVPSTLLESAPIPPPPPPGLLSIEAPGCTSSFSLEVQQGHNNENFSSVLCQFQPFLEWVMHWWLCHFMLELYIFFYMGLPLRGPLGIRNNLLLSLYISISRAALVAGLLPNATEVADYL